MSIFAIIAIAKNYAIGKDGKLPWHYPADLKFFKETTTGHAVLMGSHTWDSIGRPLPNRSGPRPQTSCWDLPRQAFASATGRTACPVPPPSGLSFCP